MRKFFFGLLTAILLLLGMNGVVAAATAVNTSTTPGATSPRATQASLCASVATSAPLSRAVKSRVFAAYSVAKKQQSRYAIDHLVPVSLGGTDDASNLWPQARSEARTKDAAELAVRSLVCANKVDLATAQQAFAGNWTTAEQVVQAKVTANEQAIAQYVEAQKKAEEQQKLQDYLKSLPPPTQAPQQGCPNGTYVNSAGNTVCSPYSSPSGPPAGATAQCRDGTYSFSQSRSGTCSSHGGVAQWL